METFMYKNKTEFKEKKDKNNFPKIFPASNQKNVK